jgi:arylsulfatase A-like enzyme
MQILLALLLLTCPVLVASPNIVLVITDDQGYGDVGVHGNPVLKTPNLDALHAESIRLTDYHVSPTCAPTRAALLTGRYSNATGVWHTIMGRSLIAADETTLPEILRAGGYRTGIFGKWHLGDNYPSRPHDRGFDVSFVHGGGGVWQTPDFFGNDYFDDTYFRNGVPEPRQGFCTDVWFQEAVKFIDESHRAGKPFFAYIATNAPHGPMWSPEADEAPYRGVEGLREPGFYGMIANLDENMGRLIRFLKENGLERDTILIFTTDNGTAAGENVHNAGMRGKKGSAYEGGHRVPFFLRWPAGGLTNPRDIGALAAHVDVLPTLLDLVGLEPPARIALHGRSLRPLLEDSAVDWPARTLVTDSQRLENLVKYRQAAVMTDGWRLVYPGPGNEPDAAELYDLRRDPGQSTDVAAQNPGIVARLKADYEAWWLATSKRADEYTRIVVGNSAENPVRLTSHDWHSDGSLQTWNQRGIRQAPAVNGHWATEVDRAGRYRIELRRWPKELDLPITAPYKDSRHNREGSPGVAIDAVEARLEVGGVAVSAPVGPQDKGAVFTVKLPKGPADLKATFVGGDGAERGAYYVYVERTR